MSLCLEANSGGEAAEAGADDGDTHVAFTFRWEMSRSACGAIHRGGYGWLDLLTVYGQGTVGGREHAAKFAPIKDAGERPHSSTEVAARTDALVLRRAMYLADDGRISHVTEHFSTSAG